MSSLEEAFGKLLGRQPNDKEKQNLHRVRDALNLKDNDALWLLLMALGHYEMLYGKVPELIRETARGTLADVKETAEAQMRASAEATKRDLAEAVARSAAQVAKDAARGRMLKWAVACVAASFSSLVLVAWFSYDQGLSGGYGRGWGEAYRQAADHKAAASWANTPEGQLAYALAKSGSLRELASCSGRGWRPKGGACLPLAENGVVYGWRLPSGIPGGR